jgi:tryptophanyl-tRNA synthetase
VKSALTDSIHGITYDRQKRPAVSNLIEILYHLDPTEARSCEELANDFKDLSMRAFKEKVANSVDLHLSSIRDKYESIIHDSSTQLLSDINEEGSRKARASANATMALVRNAVGL